MSPQELEASRREKRAENESYMIGCAYRKITELLRPGQAISFTVSDIVNNSLAFWREPDYNSLAFWREPDYLCEYAVNEAVRKLHAEGWKFNTNFTWAWLSGTKYTVWS